MGYDYVRMLNVGIDVHDTNIKERVKFYSIENGFTTERYTSIGMLFRNSACVSPHAYH